MAQSRGSIGSTSEEGGGSAGDSSVERVTSSNQDDELDGDVGQDSVYGSEDFDDQSKAGASESEVCVCTKQQDHENA